uniref:Pr1-like protein n=1 Tax=Oryza sativa subsp. japonica TaxID=39947 RepID=Q67TL4_ORYSJ|nr:pr1-like protein [Oryza sativa Japonica Group]
MVAGGGHRHGGAAAERGEGRGKRNGRSTAHPGSTTTTGTATGAEEGGGTARVDGDAAEPKEATPRWEKVRGDGGGGPELGAFPNAGFNFHEERIFRSCSVYTTNGKEKAFTLINSTQQAGTKHKNGREGAPEGGLAGTADGRGTRPRPDGHRRRPPARRSGARESGEEREAKGTVHGSPRDTRTAETTNGAEERGGAVRDDEGDGAPTVGGRNGGADEVDEDAAKPKEVSPSGEEVRSDDGGEPELGGDGGEKGTGGRRERREEGDDRVEPLADFDWVVALDDGASVPELRIVHIFGVNLIQVTRFMSCAEISSSLLRYHACHLLLTRHQLPHISFPGLRVIATSAI